MKLNTVNISYTTQNKLFSGTVPVSYQVFGQPIGAAPVVVVNHALTGNSTVSGSNGWWKDLIGNNKCIDTHHYTVIACNIPGNGYDTFLWENHQVCSVYDVAMLFLKTLQKLQIKKVFAMLGGSLGGAIAWQMTVLQPELCTHVIPIATDWKTTDWLLANCTIQDQILNHSKNPVYDARIHAMTLYRTPQSLQQKFNRSRDEAHQKYQVESWLHHHGLALQNRFTRQAYKTMNHLLRTINITKDTGNFLASIRTIKSTLHLIGVDTDLLFPNREIKAAYDLGKTIKSNMYHHTIKSIHGHDAFLLELDQLKTILQPIFKIETPYEYVSTEDRTANSISVN